MCRTGGRRCPGSSGKAKSKLRQQIHRARRAVDTARAAGDTAAVAAGEARIEAATAALTKLKEHDKRERESAAQRGDLTPPPTTRHHDTEHVTVVNTAYGGTVGIQAGVVIGGVTTRGGVHIGPGGITVAPGQPGDVTGNHTVINTNHGGTVGIQAGVVKGAVTVTAGGVHMGSGNRNDNTEPFGDITRNTGIVIGSSSGFTFNHASSDHDTEHQDAMDADRAERKAAKQARKQEKEARRQAKQARRAAMGDVTDNAGSTVRFGDITDNTGVVIGVNNSSFRITPNTGPAADAQQSTPRRDASKEQAKAEKKARKAQQGRRVSGGFGDVTVGYNQGSGVMQGNGYTVIGGSVYRHPGRTVTVRGTEVTDAATGQRIEPTRTLPNPRGGHSVSYRDGVLYVNGERID
ncbi:hypothetical protein [Kutzneria sp. CA-103260]|uniref:hypothetical protein n=1 Tax=Kutzneria sp. CA-103260 TaxID=2802641 RepID=UPI001BAC9528|nr:hypothetical protein [Kutzneria sp. CA-103260]QUQ70575.1 hypothetical protein JJ691_83550 [Kutzneria sp. CA-103260]